MIYGISILDIWRKANLFHSVVRPLSGLCFRGAWLPNFKLQWDSCSPYVQSNLAAVIPTGGLLEASLLRGGKKPDRRLQQRFNFFERDETD
ncbi:MAG TPA: hypothetical protein DCG44_05000 [Candidatus Aquiluna sp.]|nr:hypothetical protein [Aquiluna sp.]